MDTTNHKILMAGIVAYIHTFVTSTFACCNNFQTTNPEEMLIAPGKINCSNFRRMFMIQVVGTMKMDRI